MKKTLVASLFVVFAAIPHVARAQAAQEPPATMSLSGPRLGATFLSPGIVRKLRDKSELGLDVGSVITQFGWQKETRLYAAESGLAGVTEFVFLVGGLEQGVFIPSVSWLVGLRSATGAEFAVGPNLTPAGIALAVAGGVTVRKGNLNFPLNLAVVPSKSGVRVSVLAGFNTRRE